MTRLLFGTIAVAMMVVLAGWSLAARDAALREHALAEAGARPAAVRLSRGTALPAGSGDAAALLAALVADRGSAAGIRLSVRPLAATVAPGFAAVDVEARGRETALRQLARAIEGDRPVVRFVRWSIRPGTDGLLRLEARAVAPIGDGR
ncbi:hypothetical protein HL653_07560 [Sphingomonas sp. AP4-R1]|uniref:hypothetical protein n=1 Tax=Sphingomonas sp. AP4-R1 TaxID=2735134 RepID=UPI0014936EDE|nr:hypothetical protein [Sphingomonas sp. AP4-R1]QJU57664.1 hypothetical protein HL653_07560 [Sphingomonas sp. AP4-R1]